MKRMKIQQMVALSALALVVALWAGSSSAARPASAGGPLCNQITDPLTCDDDAPNGGGGQDNDVDVDVDLHDDVGVDGDIEPNLDGGVDADIHIGDSTDTGADDSDANVDIHADVDLDNDGDAEIAVDTEEDAGRATLDADGNTVTASGAAADVDLFDDDTVLADAAGILVTSTDLDADVGGPLTGEVVVLRLCHSSALDASQLAFADLAGNIVDIAAEELAVNDVILAVNTDAPCSAPFGSGETSDEELLDGDIIVAAICHSSDAAGTEFAFIDLAGNVFELAATELARNDILVAVNTDRPCPVSQDGSGLADEDLLDDELVVLAICHLSEAGAGEAVLIDETGSLLALTGHESVLNNVLVAINNGGNCPGGGSGGDDGSDDLVSGDLLVVGVCHVSEIAATAVGFVDLAGNLVNVETSVFDSNDVLVLINSDDPCPVDAGGGGGDDGGDDDTDNELIQVEVCALTDIASDTAVLTTLTGTHEAVNQQLAALGELVLGVNVDDPCPSGGSGADDDADDDDGDDDADDDDADDDDGDGDDGKGDDDDGVGGNGDDDDGFGSSDDPNGGDDSTARASDRGAFDEAEAEFLTGDSGQSAKGSPSLDTGGFGLIVDTASNPWGFAALVVAVAALATTTVGYLGYQRLNRR
jgi:hypothetical protein